MEKSEIKAVLGFCSAAALLPYLLLVSYELNTDSVRSEELQWIPKIWVKRLNSGSDAQLQKDAQLQPSCRKWTLEACISREPPLQILLWTPSAALAPAFREPLS